MSAACQGESSCEVQATNGVFGDPCGGTYKYLSAVYECVTDAGAVGENGNVVERDNSWDRSDGPCSASLGLTMGPGESFCTGYAPGDWHGSIDMSGYDSSQVCEMKAGNLSGGQPLGMPCAEWCMIKNNHLRCFHAHAVDGDTCNLDAAAHASQTLDNNGCDQVWDVAVCGCGIPDVVGGR